VLLRAGQRATATYRPFPGRHDLDFTTPEATCLDCDDDHGPSAKQEAHHTEVVAEHLTEALVAAYVRIAELEREKSLALRRLAHQRRTAA
jgi:hypothetical protein